MRAILGTVYCFGNFLSYAPDSLRFFNGLAGAAGAVPDAVQVFPFALLSLNLGLPIGARLNKALGPRLTTVIGTSLMCLGIFLGSFQTRLLPFILFYSLSRALQRSPARRRCVAGWTVPEEQGLINGITSPASPGAFIFNRLASASPSGMGDMFAASRPSAVVAAERGDMAEAGRGAGEPDERDVTTR